MPSYEEIAAELDTRALTVSKRTWSHTVARCARLMRALNGRSFPQDEIAPFLTELQQALRDANARALNTVYASLISHLEKQHGLVPPDHYRNQWMAMGMAAFGIPLGAAFAAALGSAAYIGIGLPIGLAIGSGIGANKDREAREAGRVLEVDPE